jgi:PTS system nitrogen regulatory IIA component
VKLNIREAAQFLKVSVQTIYRLIHRENLPASLSGDLFQFNRVELEEWSRQHGSALASDTHTPSERPSLRRALRHGGIHYDLQASDRDSALRALAALPGSRVALDEDTLFEVLRAREELAPTTVGDGFAIPHPRDPGVSRGELEFVHICCFEEPVQFGALDSQPVHTALLLLSQSVESHLQLLALVSLVLRDEVFKNLVQRRAEAEEILARTDALLEAVENRHR